MARLMSENGIRAKQQRVFSGRTTDSDHDLPVAPNRLDRQFEADAPNEKWTCDIISVYTKEGWLYLAVVFDLPESPRGGSRDEDWTLAISPPALCKWHSRGAPWRAGRSATATREASMPRRTIKRFWTRRGSHVA